MASVFLSYDRDDADKARPIAIALEKADHTVWWDLHVRGGAQFAKVIEEALKAADAVVVLWSENSIESAWVRDEAAAGRDSGRLVPVTIDGTEAPLGFRQFQTIDLSGWRGRGKPAQLHALIADVAAIAQGEKPPTVPSRPRLKASRFAGRNWRIAGGVAVLSGISAILVWRPWDQPTSTPTVLVTAGRNDAASQALTRDFAVQLGSVPLVQSGSLQMVTTSTQSSSDKPALALEVAGLAQPQTVGANLLLRAATDNAVVWSRDFEQGQRSIADMKLQMAYTASRVLRCAIDAFVGNGNVLPRRTLTLYLTFCGQTAEGENVDPQAVVGLSKVVAEAPRFTPVWRRLLLAEADIIESQDDPRPTPAQEEMLRKHIAAARRLDTHMPEATLAEIDLIPLTDLVTRMRLIDQASQEGPENPVVLMHRADALQAVGRTLEAVATATYAAQIDPTSPETLGNYIHVLMYSARTEVAEQQLKRAERLWPGTAMLEDTKWSFYFRIGDPKIGLQMAGDRTLYPTMQLFIQARANPTNENVEKLISLYRGIMKDRLDISLNFMSQAFTPFHRENELYAIIQRWPSQQDFAVGTDTWFRPAFHEFRRDPRFMQLAARTPLLRYWRTTGKWPDFCNEPDLPYDCKKEAAKYPV